MKTFRTLAFLTLPLALLAGCGQSAAEHLDAARQAFAHENFGAARVEALAALARDGDNPDALALLLQAQLRLGDGEGANATLDRLRRAGPQKAGIAPTRMNRFLAETVLLRGHPDQSLRLLGADGSPQAWRIRALAHLDLGDGTKAMDAFARGAAAGDDPVLLATYARQLIGQGQFDKAGAIVARLSRVAPQSFDTHMAQGQYLASRGQPARAIAAYARAAAAHPERYEPLLAQAQLVSNQGRLKDATRLLDKAAELAPDAPDLRISRLQILAAQKAWPKIASILQSSDSSLAAGSPEAMIYGEALIHVGRPEQARVLFNRALLVRPDDRQVRRLLAEAQLAAGDAEGAYQALLPLTSGALATVEDVQALRKASDAAGYIETRDIDARLASPQFRSDAAIAAKAIDSGNMANWSAAAAQLALLLPAHGSDAELLGALAEATFNAGRFAEAASWADKVLAQDPDNRTIANLAIEARRKAAK